MSILCVDYPESLSTPRSCFDIQEGDGADTEGRHNLFSKLDKN